MDPSGSARRGQSTRVERPRPPQGPRSCDGIALALARPTMMRTSVVSVIVLGLSVGCGEGTPESDDGDDGGGAPDAGDPRAPLADDPDAAPAAPIVLPCLEPGRDGQCAAVVTAGDVVIATGWIDHEFTAANVWTRAFAADGTVLWSHERPSSEGSPDGGTAIAVDAAGHPVVGGHWYSHTNTAINWLVFRPPPSAPPAMSLQGETIVGHDVVTGLAIDGGGNLAVVGHQPGDTWWVRRLGPTGAPLWTRSGDGVEAHAAAAAADGRIFVAGTAGGGAARLIAYTPDGGIAWSVTPDGAEGDDVAQDVAVGGGRVAIAGRAGADAWVAVYTLDGTLAWSATEAGAAWNGVAVDAAGGVVVTTPVRTRRYAADGAIAWTRPIGGTDVAIDASGGVVLATDTAITKLAP